MSNNHLKKFTPFFVADRQASLKILRGLNIPDESSIGIMTHANTSQNFKNVMGKFPCSDTDYCEIVKEKCPHKKDITKCKKGQDFSNKLITISDSGVFTKEGCMFDDYAQLFKEYEKMKVDYGIIIDYLKDKTRTMESAQLALDTYNRKKWSFKLIGVAQGNSIKEYVECYKSLKDCGFEHIAVGGLLEKRENTARYVKIRDETFMYEVLKSIREIDPEGWLFVLGSYAPSRHYNFLNIGIQGSDYKGWIFQYKKRHENVEKGHEGARRSRFAQVRTFIEKKIISKRQNFGQWPKLLIIPCSKTKSIAENNISAIDRYQGQYFRILKKHLNDFTNNDGFDIAILSAKYGLIEPMDNIAYYDLKMNPQKARELNKSVLVKLSQMNKSKQYKEVAINLGNSYIEAIDGYNELFNEDTLYTIFEGKIGERQKQMKIWIENIIR